MAWRPLEAEARRAVDHVPLEASEAGRQQHEWNVEWVVLGAVATKTSARHLVMETLGDRRHRVAPVCTRCELGAPSHA